MEVIVAIAIMTTIALAAASVSLNGTRTESSQERRQVAVTIANSYLEQASGLKVAINTTTGVSNLYFGRTKTDTQAAFAANASRPGVAQTNAVWDSLAPGDAPGGASLPVSPPLPPQNGTTYTVTTLIGSCYQLTTVRTSATSNPCIAAQAANSDALMRVIVIIKWTAGAQCATNGCYYQASTLLDPNADIEWVTH